jgi:hypothetical protein
VRSRGQLEPVFLPRIEELAGVLRELLQAGDVVLAMGAGNVSAVAHDLPQRLAGGGILQAQAQASMVLIRLRLGRFELFQ